MWLLFVIYKLYILYYNCNNINKEKVIIKYINPNDNLDYQFDSKFFPSVVFRDMFLKDNPIIGASTIGTQTRSYLIPNTTTPYSALYSTPSRNEQNGENVDSEPQFNLTSFNQLFNQTLGN